MNKTSDKQYFVDALADQDGFLACLRLMPNNINTCKLIEETLKRAGYQFVITLPGYQEQQRAKHITNRNNRARRMYIAIWSDHTYDYSTVDASILAYSNSDYTFPCAYLTSRDAKEATLQAIEALKQHTEQYKEEEQ